MAKVLLVTNYFGHLHITPTGNKSYYQAQNQLIKDKQYKFREIEEAEAEKFVEKNRGIDPDFKSPARANEIIADKDKEIADLRKKLIELEKADPEVTKQRDMLNELSTTPTSNSQYSEKAAEEITAKSKGK